MKPILNATLIFFFACVAGLSAQAAQVRVVQQAFPMVADRTLRLANLAGRVDLVPGTGPQVVVEATVHAAAGSPAETQKLLAGMKWVPSHDSKGREEMALSYPVESYRSYCFPRPEEKDDIPFFLRFLDDSRSSTSYRGERVRVYSRPHSGVPTLYADLKIWLPAGALVAMRNAVGPIRGETLSGTLEVGTGSGDVRFGAFAGSLRIDTGSGDVRLGSAKGETNLHTGSGDIHVGNLVGNGAVETGSGDVVIDEVHAGRLAVETGSGSLTVKQGMTSKLVAKTGSGDVNVSRVEVEELVADTGSGDVTVVSSLANTRDVKIETGSGEVQITAGPQASFDIDSHQGSGELSVGYADATLRKHGSKVVGARRGDGKTRIHIETGSGDCSISPKG